MDKIMQWSVLLLCLFAGIIWLVTCTDRLRVISAKRTYDDAK